MKICTTKAKQIKVGLRQTLLFLLTVLVLLGAGFITDEGQYMHLPAYMQKYHIGRNPDVLPEREAPSPSKPLTESTLLSREAVSAEYTWLSTLVRDDGSMTIGGDGVKIIPYFSNIAAQELVEHDPATVKAYMKWYLENLNRPDRWGLDGTIYDYEIVNGKPIPRNRYDSADSYAATFLSLVSSYVRATGDLEFVKTNKEAIDTVSRVIIDLQDPKDGLVWSKGDRLIKFLMDNTETYKGLSDWGSVLKSIGYPVEAEYCESKAAEIKNGIESSLWDEESGTYIWAIYPLGIRRRVNWNKWYPDSVSQLYPILNGIVPKDDWKAQSIYATFNSRFPQWPLLEKRDPFPWVSVAYVAQSMDDSKKVNQFLTTVEKTYTSQNRPYPWYSLESAYLIKTITAGLQNDK